MTRKWLDDADKAALKALNDEVEAAVAKRTAWLDLKMLEASSLKPGDDIYDLHSGYKLGVVTQIKRYHRGNAQYDTSEDFYYEYEETRPPPLPGEFPRCRFLNNTSRDSSTMRMGTRDEAAEAVKRRAQYDLGRAAALANP